MAFCCNCGAKLEAGDRFCTECAAPVEEDVLHMDFRGETIERIYVAPPRRRNTKLIVAVILLSVTLAVSLGGIAWILWDLLG